MRVLKTSIVVSLPYIAETKIINPGILESRSESCGDSLAGDHFHDRVRLSWEFLRSGAVVIAILHAAHKQVLAAIGSDVVIQLRNIHVEVVGPRGSKRIAQQVEPVTDSGAVGSWILLEHLHHVRVWSRANRESSA